MAANLVGPLCAGLRLAARGVQPRLACAKILECLALNRNAPAEPRGPMNYYYAVNGNQTGPVSEEELRRLVSAGTIPATTPVWREGMADWQPFSAALGGAGGGAAVVECTVCHQSFPADQTIR